MKNLLVKLMFIAIMFLGTFYASTGIDGNSIVDERKIIYGLLAVIVSVIVIIKIYDYE